MMLGGNDDAARPDGQGQDASGSGSGPEPEPKERRRRTGPEWLTLAISTALVLAVVGLVVYLSVTGGVRPPTFAATPLAEEIRHEGETYYLPVTVTNEGDLTAADVVVVAELTTGADPPETAEFTIDFLAGGETAEATVAFTADPTAGDLTVGVASFR